MYIGGGHVNPFALAFYLCLWAPVIAVIIFPITLYLVVLLTIKHHVLQVFGKETDLDKELTKLYGIALVIMTPIDL